MIARRARLTVALCAASALVALLAGCSGGGRDVSAQVTTTGSFLSDQATLLALNKTWLPVLFPGFFSVGGGGSPSEVVITDGPDGSQTQTYTDSDGTQETWLVAADYSTMEARLVHPGGDVETQSWSLAFTDDGGFDATEVVAYPGGAHLERSLHAPPWSDDPDHLYNSQTGRFTLASGKVLDFTMSQFGLHSVLHVDGHEGWIYEVSLPTVVGLAVPDTSRSATGTLTRGTQVTRFALPANPGGTRWQSMTLTAPGGITGTYALGVVLTGTGTVKQSGQILMTVTWGSDGNVAATFADGHSGVGQPSAAARDFLIDKWLWDLASFGPSPR